MQEITQEYVRSLFTYRNGNLYWKIRKQRINIGDEAGTISKHGYRKIRINYKEYMTHRLIFLYYNGYLPKYIDHIDGNKLNNNINNLRKVTASQNCMNRKKEKECSSQYIGVYWKNNNNKWCAQIQINGKKKHIGLFKLEIDAAITYNNKAIELFGKYANLNIIKGE